MRNSDALGIVALSALVIIAVATAAVLPGAARDAA